MTARPGAWVPGIGWVAVGRDVPHGSLIAYYVEDCTPTGVVEANDFTADDQVCLVYKWADETMAIPDLVGEVERLRRLLIEAECAFMDCTGNRSAMLAADKEWRTEAQRLAALSPSDGGDQ